MRLEQHVLHAIDDFDQGKKDSALMHACFAIDGTARKIFPKNGVGRQGYKNCIRKYWWLVEPFIGSGLNLEETKWTHITLDDGHGKKIIDPDLADIIYHVFRCSHAHAEEVPLRYELLPVSDGYSTWAVGIDDGSLQMPERIIWALLAISVFSGVNSDIKTDGDYYLTWGSESLGIGIHRFVIKEWWGREDDMRGFLSQFNHIRVKMVL